MRSRILASMAVVLICVSYAPAQTTRSASELAKENAELKARLAKLEAYTAELEAKIAGTKYKTAPAIPFTPAPYGYELPAPPFQTPEYPVPKFRFVPQPGPQSTSPAVPSPAPRFDPQSVIPAPSSPKENWQPHRFNGLDYYVVPLE